MGFDDVTAVDFSSADTTVIWALGTRETALGPAVGPSAMIEESVFLLETKPKVVVFVGFH